MLLSDKDLLKAYQSLADQDNKLAPAGEFADDVAAIASDMLKGDHLNFLSDDFRGRVEFRRGELTIVAGASGHGKSALTGQIALDLADQKRKVCIISLEMTPARTLWRMARNMFGYRVCGRMPSHKKEAADCTDKFLETIDKQIFLLDKVGSATPVQVFGTIVKAVNEFGVRHVIIDNLMRVCPEYGDKANESQKDFIQNLIALTKRLNIHTWLVHHVRKGMNEDEEINKYSIRGAAAITDNADNILLFQRNLKKEKKREPDGHYEDSVDQNEPDNVLVVDKQRNGEWQGRIPLWYSAEFMRFYPSYERGKKERIASAPAPQSPFVSLKAEAHPQPQPVQAIKENDEDFWM